MAEPIAIEGKKTAAALPPQAGAKLPSAPAYTLSPDYQRWVSIAKNLEGLPPTAAPYLPFIVIYTNKPPGYEQLERKKFTGANEYTGDLMSSLLGTSSSYGAKIREATQLTFDYQVKIPRRSADPLENIAADAAQISRYPIFSSRITALTGCRQADCKEDSLIVAGCAVNELARTLNPGEKAQVKLVAGLYFDNGQASNGWGHAWTVVSTAKGTNVIDLSVAPGRPAAILPGDSRDRVGIAAYYVDISIDANNRPEFVTGQQVLLAPPKKNK